MNYDLEKLKEEINKLETIFLKLESEWENISDYEDLYKLYPFLTTTAALSRKFIDWGIKNIPNLEIIEQALDNKVDTSIYLYSDAKKFFNGKKRVISLKEVCDYFLHQSEYHYIDDRKVDGFMKSNNYIYLGLKTDKLCKSCSIANNGFFKEDKPNYKKTNSFVVYSDCICTKYINIRSYINSLKSLCNLII